MKKVNLIILDGFGLAPVWGGNAISLARMPHWKAWWHNLPHSSLAAHGQAVGLPGHEIGNSEVGHLTIGSGRVIPQDSSRINQTIYDKSFFSNPHLLKAFQEAKQGNKAIHIMGLLSDGGVHASINHLEALLHMAYGQKPKRIYLHLFTDGRDTPAEQGIVLLNRLQKTIDQVGLGQIATIIGRYFAMDRDNRWDRTQKAIDCLTKGTGSQSNSPAIVFADAYKNHQTDEFIYPTTIVNDKKQPVGLIQDGDPVIFFNFRSDRARQISSVLLQTLPNIHLYTFIPYGFGKDTKLAERVTPIFEQDEVTDSLAAIIAKQGLEQLHIAETEKYAHVTYFFNAGQETEQDQEDRILIPSPKVPTYDQTPEMSAQKISNELIKNLKGKKYSFIVTNFANADMVGHTGNIKAAISAVECLDELLGQIVETAQNKDWWTIITADHGNVEEMVDPVDGSINPEHTRNPVPFIILPPSGIDPALLQRVGTLADVAPTILQIMELQKPAVMTGKSLIIS